MNSESPHGVKDVFLAALELPPGQREAFVQEALAQDAVSRAEVVRLLRDYRDGDDSKAEHRDRVERKLGMVAIEDARPRPPYELGERVAQRYELIENLDAGAFGFVFRAHDVITDDEVAVKLVPTSNPLIRQWLLREVATLHRAHVPGVVTLLSSGTEREWAYLVMEFVHGTHFPGGDDLAPDVVIARSVALLEALGHLHAMSVCHRDLKPSNVLVSDAGRVTIVDLGIAEDSSDALRGSVDQPLVGTPVYMAPERLRGEVATVRSDLYAVGVIIVETLTGLVPAVRLSDTGTWFDHFEVDVRARLAGLVQPGVSELLGALLAPRPEDRPASVADALARLPSGCAPPALELPFLGSDSVVAHVVEAARSGASVDLHGLPGSGRTRTLREAERLLVADGYLVQWVRPTTQQRVAEDSLIGMFGEEPSVIDEARVRRLRTHIRDGLILFVDDFESLDRATQDLTRELGEFGTVVRVLRHATHDSLTPPLLQRDDLRAIIRGPQRIFHIPEDASELLWDQTRGLPVDVVRVARLWCGTGLAHWDGGLHVDVHALDTLRRLAVTPLASPDSCSGLSELGRAAWSVLTLASGGISAHVIANVLQQPHRVVESEISPLLAARYVVGNDDGTLALLRASPLLATLAPDVHAAWNERLAAQLPARSETRFRHLILAGKYAEACTTGLETARMRLQSGRLDDAQHLLDVSLGLARTHAPHDADLYAGLMAEQVATTLGSASVRSIQLAQYHSNLAPVRDARIAAWSHLLEAALVLVQGDAAHCLTLVDGLPPGPTREHDGDRASIALLAARRAETPERAAHRLFQVAVQVRLRPDRSSRARLAAWTGWLRYDQGNFSAAQTLHARAARLASRGTKRARALCNAAFAALESHDLSEAVRLALLATEDARRARNWTDELRSIIVQRQAAYRSDQDLLIDPEVLECLPVLHRSSIRGTLELNEAAVAFRSQRLQLAHRLAREAEESLRIGGVAAAALLARALGWRCVALPSTSDPDGAPDWSKVAEPIGITAQSIALARAAGVQLDAPVHLLDRVAVWAQNAPNPAVRREVLAPGEVVTALSLGSDLNHGEPNHA